MPKASKSVAPTTQPAIDFAAQGHVLALAQLAEEIGMTVKDAADLPDRLQSAGLPAKLGHSVIQQAHRLHRDTVDGMLFRCGWLTKCRELRLAEQESPDEDAPVFAPAQAKEIVETIQAEKREEEQSWRADAQRRDKKRTSSMTQKDERAVAQRAAQSAQAPEAQVAFLGDEL